MYFDGPQPCILYKMQPRLCTNEDFEPTAADTCHSFCRETTLGSLANVSIRLALSICRHLLPFSQQKITSMIRKHKTQLQILLAIPWVGSGWSIL